MAVDSAAAKNAFLFGLLSLVLFWVCLGPIAGLLAIPGLVYARRAMEDVRTGRIPESSASQAKTGRVLSWITIGLSLGLVVVYGGLFALAAMGVF